MDMRTMKENIHLEQPTGQTRGQAAVSGEITLPGGLREEARVLHAGGMAVIDHVEALQDKVAVTGKVVFHTLYTQGDHSKVCGMEATADFSHTMELTGTQPRDLCRAEAHVEQVEASAVGGRLSLRGMVSLWGSTLSQQPVEAVVGLAGSPCIESRTQEVQVLRTMAVGEDEMLLREELSLPEGSAIRDTLYATARPQVEEITGGLGRCGITGRVELEAVHASDMPGKPVIITRHSIPFDHVVELSSPDGDRLQGAVSIRDVAVASQDTGDGQRILRAEVLLGLRGWAEKQEEATLLADAYTTSGENLRLSRQSLLCCTNDSTQQMAESGKTLLMLPEGSQPVRSMLCAFATPVAAGREQVGGRLTVEGMLAVSLLYMTDDTDAPVSASMEVPFRMTFAVQTGDEDFLSLTCSDVDAVAITSDRVELRYVMHLQVSHLQAQPVRLVTEVLPVPADAPDGSIVLYFTQPGENRWDIARRYRIPEKELQALNPDLPSAPKPGQGVVVWHRMA